MKAFSVGVVTVASLTVGLQTLSALQLRMRNLVWPAPMCSRATRPRAAWRTRTSSPYGKLLTQTSPC
ncbi:exported hypothetical protein [Acidobacteriia bacterium SbA2]|nr:exported hypothetical protein [Acidobacteriia bacterium SbA2]